MLFEFEIVDSVSEFKVSFSIREFESDIFEMWKDAQSKTKKNFFCNFFVQIQNMNILKLYKII